METVPPSAWPLCGEAWPKCAQATDPYIAKDGMQRCRECRCMVLIIAMDRVGLGLGLETECGVQNGHPKRGHGAAFSASGREHATTESLHESGDVAGKSWKPSWKLLVLRNTPKLNARLLPDSSCFELTVAVLAVLEINTSGSNFLLRPLLRPAATFNSSSTKCRINAMHGIQCLLALLEPFPAHVC